jgi:hypothetical protein
MNKSLLPTFPALLPKILLYLQLLLLQKTNEHCLGNFKPCQHYSYILAQGFVSLYIPNYVTPTYTGIVHPQRSDAGEVAAIARRFHMYQNSDLKSLNLYITRTFRQTVFRPDLHCEVLINEQKFGP